MPDFMPDSMPDSVPESVSSAHEPDGAHGRSLTRRLDDAVVPRLQRAARWGVSLLGAPFRALRRWETGFARGRPFAFLWDHRQGVLLLTAVIAFVGSFVHLQRFPDQRAAGADAGTGARPVADDRSSPDALAGGAVTVGPAVGTPLPGYVERRRDALREAPADERRVAVVSFTTYLTADESAAVLSDAVDVLSVQLRLPDEEMAPVQRAVDGDLAEIVAEVLADERDRIVREEAEFEELLGSGTVEDEDFVREFETQLERLRAVRNLIDSGSGTVFAVVVEGAVDDLRDLSGDARVRLVDLAPAEIEVAASDLYGLLPDDRERASYGSIG